MISSAMLARRTDRQDHDPANQGRTHPRGGETRQRPPRTGAARAPGARGRPHRIVDRSAGRSARRRERASVGYRGCDSDVRARGRLRAALRRARAIGLWRKRCPRRAEARDQHPRQFGSRRGEELRLTGLSRGWRSSVRLSAYRSLALSASAGAASCSRTPIVAPRRQTIFASRTSPVSSICTARRGGSPMSRAKARRKPSRDRSHIRPSQTKR